MLRQVCVEKIISKNTYSDNMYLVSKKSRMEKFN